MMKKLGTVTLVLVLVMFPMLALTGFSAKDYLWNAFYQVTKKTAMITAQNGTREALNHWFGIRMYQFPTDLWSYQSFINETNPDYVIETGTFHGGLTLYLAMMLDYRNDHGKVITIDINAAPWKKTVQSGKIKQRLLDRITFIEGSSTAPEVLDQVSELVAGKNVLIILDTLHTKDHVLDELQLYAKLVPVNGYILVNDTHHDKIYSVEGPMAAVTEFLKTHDNFIMDHSKDKFMVSCFHSGILKRTR